MQPSLSAPPMPLRITVSYYPIGRSLPSPSFSHAMQLLAFHTEMPHVLYVWTLCLFATRTLATAGAGRFQFPWTTTLHLFTPVLSLMLLLRDLDHVSCLPLSVQHSPLLGALVHVQPPLASPAAALHRVQQQQHQFVTSQGTLSTLDTSFAPPS
jgi:hypothetical protein